MLSLKQLAEQIQATYLGDDIALPNVCIDSRHLVSGDLFVAIIGPNVNGHDFIAAAIEAGAGAVLAQHETASCPVPQIIVPDTLKALGNMAKVWRMQFDIPVVALTGSCGKTSTKEIIASILHCQGRTLATPGNRNNYYSLPQTVLALRPEHEFAVIEMGTNNRGEIAYLAEITHPNVSLITNIRACHLEGLGSLQGVSEEKSDIYKYLLADGAALVNLDEPYAPSWQDKIADRVQVTFSARQEADIYVKSHHADSTGTTATLVTPAGECDVKCALLGQHVVENIVAAVAAAFTAGAELAAIQKGISQVQSVKGRMQQHQLSSGAVVIDDTYNASASSVETAMHTLAELEGNTFFVMSNMGELGDHEQTYHTQMGEWAQQYGVKQLWLYGNHQLLKHTLAAFPKAKYFADKAELIDALKEAVTEDARVLVKGSRANQMEDVVNALLEEELA